MDTVRLQSSERRSTTTRSTSLSSTTSDDGSAASLSETGPSEQEGESGASAFVMPSLHLAAAAVAPPAGAESGSGRGDGTRHAEPAMGSAGGTPSESESQPAPPPGATKVLVLGLAEEDRRTFAKLVSFDDRQARGTSAPSARGPDLEYSFLSTTSSASRARSDSERARPSGTFEPLLSSFGPVSLFQPRDSRSDPALLLEALQMPLERLEAKINRTYPATDGLADLIAGAGCGPFDGCFYLFSSPPTAAEVAAARPLSHLLPLFPVLILPPSPTGKPQKTFALCQAVQEQLDGAGVRWLPATKLETGASRRHRDRSPGGPLFMLPHDLFMQQTPANAGPSSPGSSRYSPSSLSASQELDRGPPTPQSPAFTGISSAPPSSIGTGDAPYRREGPRSLSASGPPSTCAGSSASRSDSRRRDPRRRRRPPQQRGFSSSGSGSSCESDSDWGAGYASTRHLYGSSTSLADLKRLQAILHDEESPAVLRDLSVRAFLEWREVEVVARGIDVAWRSASDLDAAEGVPFPAKWGETLLAQSNERTESLSRRALDFSRRVAERRQVLALRGVVPGPAAGAGDAIQRGRSACSRAEVDRHLDADARDAIDSGAPISTSTTREWSTHTSSLWTDPTTPRCVQRPLPPQSASLQREDDGGGSYFPAPGGAAAPQASSPWSETSSSEAEEDKSSSPDARRRSPSPAPALAPNLLLYHLSPDDPFHLPSLLRLVGLNLRLSFGSHAALLPVFFPSRGTTGEDRAGTETETKEPRSGSEEQEKTEAEERRRAGAWSSWWRAVATVGLVFAAGVALGAQVLVGHEAATARIAGPPVGVGRVTTEWTAWAPTVFIRA
ncbi:hypothetical protein JCM8202v2_002782 [Rhodotorula sphaerocarpa]